MMYYLPIILLFTFTLISGFYASSETAYFSVPTARIQFWRKSSDRRKRMAATLLSHSRQLLVLIFILHTIINVLIQNTASDLSDTFGQGWILKVAIPFGLILIFGEFLPKYLGRINSERIALFAAPFYTRVEKFTAPIQRAITHLAEVLARLFFFFLKPEPPLTPKEVEGVIMTCETHNILSPEEGSLLRQSLEFERKSARDVMTPRFEMRAIKRSQLSQLNKIQTGTLIIDEEIDRPIGALSSKEVLLFQANRTDDALSSASRELFFVPEVMSARRLLQEFSERGASMACVIDEHGTVSGFVEKQKLAQKLLQFQPLKEKEIAWQQQSIAVSGTTPLETINSLFGTSITSPYHTATIGGWLSEVLDDVPSPGASYITDNFIFRVLSADEKQVKQVFIQKRQKKKRRKE